MSAPATSPARMWAADDVRREGVTLRGILEYVGVDASASLVRSLVAEQSQRTPEMSSHQTAGGPRESIGRWRRELEPVSLEACEEAFGAALEQFGYA